MVSSYRSVSRAVFAALVAIGSVMAQPYWHTHPPTRAPPEPPPACPPHAERNTGYRGSDSICTERCVRRWGGVGDGGAPLAMGRSGWGGVGDGGAPLAMRACGRRRVVRVSLCPQHR